MNKIFFIITFILSVIASNAISQVYKSEYKYYDKPTPAILADINYPYDLTKDALKKYCQKLGYSFNPISLKYYVYPKVNITKNDNQYNLYFKLDEIKKSDFTHVYLYLMVLSSENKILDSMVKSPVFDAAEKWMKTFLDFLYKEYSLDREIEMEKYKYQEVQTFYENTLVDSVKQITTLKDKIVLVSRELHLLQNDLASQVISFSKTKKEQLEIIDQTKKNIDSLTKIRTNTNIIY